MDLSSSLPPAGADAGDSPVGMACTDVGVAAAGTGVGVAPADAGVGWVAPAAPAAAASAVLARHHLALGAAVAAVVVAVVLLVERNASRHSGAGSSSCTPGACSTVNSGCKAMLRGQAVPGSWKAKVRARVWSQPPYFANYLRPRGPAEQ